MNGIQVGYNVRNIFNGEIGAVLEVLRNGKMCRVTFPNGIKTVLAQDLETVSGDIFELFSNRNFGNIDDLKRSVTYSRIKGDVTNILYSMGTSNAEFLPYQYIPVIKFIDSISGRILVADEVGLGKTIEAIYIWKELLIRENAKRLLIVCPSVLRDKWANDLKRYFSIEAQICTAGNLLTKCKDAVAYSKTEHFALIASLEGIRYKEKQNEKTVNKPAKQELYEYLENERELFDLVIVDEAHYLRNSETANHKSVSRLRNNAKNLVLLSATPIQTESRNLYNLLNILEPEVFNSEYTFKELLRKSSNYIEMANALQTNEVTKVKEQIEKWLDYIFWLNYENSDEELQKDKAFAKEISENLPQILENPELRMEYRKRLMNKVFYAPYFTRTRRCETEMEYAARRAVTWNFTMNSTEQKVYDEVSHLIEEKIEKSCDKRGFASFVLIAKQRQMTSCIYAAIKKWKEQKFGKELEEQLFEDFDKDLDEEDKNDFKIDFSNAFSDSFVEGLKKADSKYNALLGKLKERWQENPNTKMIIFSFFRGTVNYLSERLSNDGVKNIALTGGANGINKQEVIDSFREDDSVRLLISTEVLSEGVDLQFCETIINYDLPWNPMRVEQRIGRIDRIGQKSDVIHIFNISCSGTVEDRVLSRLYERIDIFKRSIGNINDILGKEIEDIAFALIDGKLTPEEKEKKANEKIDALIANKFNNEKLEKNAPRLLAFKGDVLQGVRESYDNKRIRAEDLLFYVSDYFNRQGKGSSVKNAEIEKCKLISLSKWVAQDFINYCYREGLDCLLKNSGDETLCVFDPTIKGKIKRKKHDTITVDHPLIRWITEQNKDMQNGCCCSILIELPNREIPIGMYVFYLMEIQAEGCKSRKEIRYYIGNIESGNLLDSKISETVLWQILSNKGGRSVADTNLGWEKDISNDVLMDKCLDKIQNEASSDFEKFEHDFKQDNESIRDNQLDYLQTTMEKKKEKMNESIREMKRKLSLDVLSEEEKRNLNRGIKLQEDKLKKLLENYEIQKQKIEGKSKVQCSYHDIAVGLLKII